MGNSNGSNAALRGRGKTMPAAQPFQAVPHRLKTCAALGILIMGLGAGGISAQSISADHPARSPKAGAVAGSEPSASQAADMRIEGERIVTSQGWFPRPQVIRPPLPEKVQRAYVIPIHGPISGTTQRIVARKMLEALAGGAQMIIFDMDTPGGELEAMMTIVQGILDDLSNVYTVAWVHPKAYSAGAIISLACNEIVMSPTGVMGDAMPILVGPAGVVEMPSKERAKKESAMRGQVRLLAQRNGYWPILCESMITLDLEVWLIRQKQTHELRYVDAAQWRDNVSGSPGGGKAGADWEYLSTAESAGTLLTMTALEAQRMGFTRHLAADMTELCRQYNIVADPIRLEDSWAEGVIYFLNSPWVLGLLFFGGLLAVYVEIHTGGFGLAGTVAVLCFAVLFGARFMTGLAQWWEIVLFVLGAILLLVEVFVTTGHIVPGVIGAILCVVALLAVMVPNAPGKLPWPHGALSWTAFRQNLMALGLGLAGAVAAGAILARYMPRIPIGRRLVLQPPAQQTVPATTADSPILKIRPGQVGRVVQICRPVGKVWIEGMLADAVADGAFLPEGAEVVVLRNEGNRIVVEARTA